MEHKYPLWAAARGLGYYGLRANALAGAVMALEEPWRSRFVEFIVRHADPTFSYLPSEREIALWLEDPILYRRTRRLLRAWPH